MHWTSLAAMFALGLAGSLHCVQMCGPIVLSFGVPMAANSRRRQAIAHGAYHLGRVLTYALLGLAAGWAGAGVAFAGSLAGIRNTAAIVGGALMIAAGLAVLGAARSSGLVKIGGPSRFARWTGRLLRSASPRGRFVTGLAMGFLPCGMIYAALLRSVAVASPREGALAMLAFGLGTAGPLLGLGVCSVAITRWIGLSGQKWAAAGVMTMGLVLVCRGITGPSAVTLHDHAHHMSQVQHGHTR